MLSGSQQPSSGSSARRGRANPPGAWSLQRLPACVADPVVRKADRASPGLAFFTCLYGWLTGLQAGRPLFRPGWHQAKGLVSCVYAPVSAQTSPLGKGASTTRVGADVDHMSGVNPLVCSQIAGVAEGALAVGVRAGKGSLSGMNPYVRLQIPGLGKGASTARVGAGKGALSGMNPLVRL